MSSSPATPAALAGQCVLLVDDDQRSTKLIGVLLRDELCHVQKAHDAVSALRLLFAGLDAALLVVDLQLPDMSGLDLVRTVRAWQPTQQLRIVAMSASGPEYSEAVALAAGCNSFVAKPIDPDTFVARLHAALVASP